MRNISNSILNKLNLRVQAGANKLTASLWVGRPVTPLTENRLLEKQNIFSSDNITAIDISACHPNIMRGATYIYVAYIESGIAKIKRAKHKEDFQEIVWEDVNFSQEAVDISICFDGIMPKATNGSIEFITEENPWIFWVNSNGVLYGKKLGQENVIILAETNCTVVSSVRAMWSSAGDFDFGLIIFFLLNGTIYYRQLINGNWKDAEIVSFGPADTTYVDLAAFRTWDYRVGVQVKSADNKFYELFTQFMGVGKQNVEHLEIKNISSKGKITQLTKSDFSVGEHVGLTSIENTSLYGGLYSLSVPKFVQAYNVEDENGDWGTTVIAKLDVHVVKEQVESLYAQFGLVDSWNIRYTPSSAVLHGDGKTITFKFINFNNASGTCKIKYFPGTINSMAGITLEETYLEFVPQNLVPIDAPLPEVESIWNE